MTTKEKPAPNLVKVKLLKTHTHKGEELKPGAIIEDLTEDLAAALVAGEVAEEV